jgi:hypothetical protein
MLNVSLKTSWFGAVIASTIALGAGQSAAQLPPLPEEAYTACADKSSGDACTVTFREQTMTGSCVAHPSSKRLFCMPAGGPPGR